MSAMALPAEVFRIRGAVIRAATACSMNAARLAMSALLIVSLETQPSWVRYATLASSGMAASRSRADISVWSRRAANTTQPIRSGDITGAAII